MQADELISNRPLTPAELGEAFGVTGRTILNWEAAGIIRPLIRVGRIVRYDLDDAKKSLAAATDEAVSRMREERSAS
jgi:DNA-binding transcriptional MerR regulator